MKSPKHISDWRKAGLALPDLSVVADESDIPDDLVELTAALPRPDLGIALFDCPRLDGPFLEHDGSWQPMATIYGPLHGMDLQWSGAFRDVVEIYFRKSAKGKIEFQTSWIGLLQE
jgi:hypothetical protein